MFDDEGHWLDDPIDIVYGPELDFKGLGLRISVHRTAVFADFDKMVSHLAKVHNLKQDEIGHMLAVWLYEQPGCLKANINL